MRLCLIPPDRVADFLPHIGWMLRRAYQRGVLGSTFEELREDLDRDLAQLWIIHNDDRIVAAVATSIETSRTVKFCVIRAIGGRGLRKWLHLIEQIEAWAKDQGCDAVRIYGRKGWERVLHQRYLQPYTVIERRL